MGDLDRIFSHVEENQSRIYEIVRMLAEKPSVNPPGDTTEPAEVTASLLSSMEFNVELVKETDQKVNVVAE